jgi:hypothetical protein
MRFYKEGRICSKEELSGVGNTTSNSSGSSGSSNSSGSSKLTTGIAVGTILVSALTLYFTIRLHNEDQQATRREKLLEHRREMLFSALKVIDNVYSNEPFNGQPPVHPLEFEVQTARDIDNGIRIYCEYPETVASFRKALGLFNPSEGEKPKGVNPEALDQFRAQVAKELDLPNPIGTDRRLVWISNLDGAKK